MWIFSIKWIRNQIKTNNELYKNYSDICPFSFSDTQPGKHTEAELSVEDIQWNGFFQCFLDE